MTHTFHQTIDPLHIFIQGIVFRGIYSPKEKRKKKGIIDFRLKRILMGQLCAWNLHMDSIRIKNNEKRTFPFLLSTFSFWAFLFLKGRTYVYFSEYTTQLISSSLEKWRAQSSPTPKTMEMELGLG